MIIQIVENGFIAQNLAQLSFKSSQKDVGIFEKDLRDGLDKMLWVCSNEQMFFKNGNPISRIAQVCKSSVSDVFNTDLKFFERLGKGFRGIVLGDVNITAHKFSKFNIVKTHSEIDESFDLVIQDLVVKGLTNVDWENLEKGMKRFPDWTLQVVENKFLKPDLWSFI